MSDSVDMDNRGQRINQQNEETPFNEKKSEFQPNKILIKVSYTLNQMIQKRAVNGYNQGPEKCVTIFSNLDIFTFENLKILLKDFFIMVFLYRYRFIKFLSYRK